jgi:hypothetical protein
VNENGKEKGKEKASNNAEKHDKSGSSDVVATFKRARRGDKTGRCDMPGMQEKTQCREG